MWGVRLVNAYVTSACFSAHPCAYPRAALTNVREILENGALHRQFVQVGIQEREDAIRKGIHIVFRHPRVWAWNTDVSRCSGGPLLNF